MLADESERVMPEGSVPVASVTLDANPAPGVMVMVAVPDAPCATVTLDGAADNVKEGVTVTATVVELVRLPLAAVILIEYTPAAAVLVAATVSALLPDPGAAIVDGENATVTPLGCPLAVSTTALLNPLATAVDSVAPALDPCATLTPATFAVTVKAATIVSFTVAVDVMLPPVAVIVIVAVPGTAAAPAAMVSTLDPDPGAAKLADASVAVTPVGTPLTASLTAPLNPPARLTAAVDVPLPPSRTVNEVADIARLIEGVAVVAASPQ